MTMEPGGAEFRPPTHELLPISREAADLGRSTILKNPDQQFQATVQRLFDTQPQLYRFYLHRSGMDEEAPQDDIARQLAIDTGITTGQERVIPDESVKRHSYQDGALLTFRIFEEQSRISNKPVPEVSRDIRNEYDLALTHEDANIATMTEDPVDAFEEATGRLVKRLEEDQKASELVTAVRLFVDEHKEGYYDVDEALKGAADIYFLIRNQIQEDKRQKS